MSKEILQYGGIEIGKSKFHHCKNLILLQGVNTTKLQVHGFFKQIYVYIYKFLLITKIMIITFNQYA